MGARVSRTMRSSRGALYRHAWRISTHHGGHAQSGESEEKALEFDAHDYLTDPVQTGCPLTRVRAGLLA